MAAVNSSVSLETLQAPVDFEHLPLLCTLLHEESPGWEQFGNALHVDYNTIQGIRLQPLRLEPRQQMISLLNKIQRENPNMYTWEEIKRVLTALRNNRLASKVTKENKTGPVTCSTEELLTFLEDEVPNWKRFGSHMKVSHATLNAMDSDKLTPTNCLEELLTKWIKEKAEKATLAEIFRACHSVKNHALAKKLENNEELRKEFCSAKQNNSEKPADISERKPADFSERKPADISERKPANMSARKPADILREQLPNIVDAVTNAEDLADRIKAANLIASSTVDDILDEHPGRAKRVRRFLSIIERNLTIDLPGIDPNATLNKFCEVLKKQNEQNLTIIAENMQEQLQ